MNRREELTRFLKSARARLSPADVGLPTGERRRTKGLRREEVASLSGMSVTWYTWFEQGRDVQLSAPMLDRLSASLRLGPEEREFLFALAQHRPPPLGTTPQDEVSPAVTELLHSINLPALVMTADWMVVAWNGIFRRIFRDYSLLPPEERNLLKVLLFSPDYRGDEAEYLAMARRLIARFKWDYSRATDDSAFGKVIAELEEKSEIFRKLWHDPAIVAHFEGVHSANVEGVGTINFRHTSYAIEQSPGQRLVLYAPIDPESAARLRLVDDREGPETEGGLSPAGDIPEASK